jgi:hypothetical protein
MTDRNLVRVLRAVAEQKVAEAPKQHSLRTPQCPPLTRFPAAARSGWTPEEEAHIRSCPYCRKVIAMNKALEGQEQAQPADVDALAANGAPRAPVVLKFPKPRAVPVSRALARPAAAPPQDYARASAPGSLFEADLYTFDGGVVLEIFARSAALSKARLHFSLRDGDGREVLSGEMVLEPNEAGLPTAARALSAEEVDRLNGACSGVAVGVAER